MIRVPAEVEGVPARTRDRVVPVASVAQAATRSPFEQVVAELAVGGVVASATEDEVGTLPAEPVVVAGPTVPLNSVTDVDLGTRPPSERLAAAAARVEAATYISR